MRKLFLLMLLSCSLISTSQSFDCGTSTVTDIDGNLYHTVKIGSQCWLKENMRTTRYSDGQLVGISEIAGTDFQEYINMPGKLQVNVFLSREEKLDINIYDIAGRTVSHSDLVCNSGSSRVEISIGPIGLYIVQIKGKSTGSNFKVMGCDQNTIGVNLLQNTPTILKNKSDTIVLDHMSRYCFDYDNDPANSEKFGKLYTSLSALNVDSSHYDQPVQGICPNGWHVPSDAEWSQFEIAIGMDSIDAIYGYMTYRGTVGGKLKTSEPGYWDWGDGTDDFGFSAKGSGFYYNQGVNEWDFYFLTKRCSWWTYRQYGLMSRGLININDGIYRGFEQIPSANSFRCIKNP